MLGSPCTGWREEQWGGGSWRESLWWGGRRGREQWGQQGAAGQQRPHRAASYQVEDNTVKVSSNSS